MAGSQNAEVVTELNTGDLRPGQTLMALTQSGAMYDVTDIQRDDSTGEVTGYVTRRGGGQIEVVEGIDRGPGEWHDGRYLLRGSAAAVNAYGDAVDVQEGILAVGRRLWLSDTDPAAQLPERFSKRVLVLLLGQHAVSGAQGD